MLVEDRTTAMKRHALFALCFIPALAIGQVNLFDNLYWSGKGNRTIQEYGAWGVSCLGRINDSIPHALAISEVYYYQPTGAVPTRSAYILNRYPGDTARIYEFPGQTVKRAKFNRDSFPDFLCRARKEHA
jgi:hypothetical protein